MDKDIEKLLSLAKSSKKTNKDLINDLEKISDKTEKPDLQKTISQNKESLIEGPSKTTSKDNAEKTKPKEATKSKPTKRTIREAGKVNPSDVDVFIKIDDHVNIAKTLIDSKKELKSISDTILLLAKAEKLKKEAIEKMEQHLKILKKEANEVYTKMAQYGKYVNYKDNLITKHTLEPIDDLEKELEEIKKELSQI